MDNLMTSKQIKSKIAGIKKSGNTRKGNIHDIGIQCMLHAAKHGDTTLMDRLYNALNESDRRTSFVVWVTDHTPMQFRTIEDSKGNKVKAFRIPKITKRNPENKPFRIDAANDTPYWEYKREQSNEADPYTLDEAQKKLAKYLDTFAKRCDDTAIVFVKQLQSQLTTKTK